jgi:hypothetical protein
LIVGIGTEMKLREREREIINETVHMSFDVFPLKHEKENKLWNFFH